MPQPTVFDFDALSQPRASPSPQPSVFDFDALEGPQGPPPSMIPGPTFVGPPEERTGYLPPSMTPEFWRENLGKPLDVLNRALGYIRRPIDIAANRYSGLPDWRNPHVEPVPIPELAKEALLPREKSPAPLFAGGVAEMAGGLPSLFGGIEHLRETSPGAAEVASDVVRPLVGFGAGLASDPTTYGAVGVLKKAGATGEALHGLLSAAFTGTMGKGAVDAAHQFAAQWEKSGFSRDLIEPGIEFILAAAGTVMGARGTMEEANAHGERLTTERQARANAEAETQAFLDRAGEAPPFELPPDQPFDPTKGEYWGETQPSLERTGLQSDAQLAEQQSARDFERGIVEATDAPAGPPRLAREPFTVTPRARAVARGEQWTDTPRGRVFLGDTPEARVRAGLDPEPPPDLSRPGEPATLPPEQAPAIDQGEPFQLPEDGPPLELPVENVTENRFKGNTKEALDRAGLTPSKSIPEQVREAQRLRAIESKGIKSIPLKVSETGAARVGPARKVVEVLATGEKGTLTGVKNGVATIQVGTETRTVRPHEVKVVGEEPLGGLRPGQGPVPLTPPTPPPAPRPPEVAKVIEAIKTAKPVRNVQEQLYTAEYARRAEKLGKIQESPRGEENLREAKQALSGALPKAGGFEGVRSQLTPEEVGALHDRITTHRGIDKFERVRAGDALNKILDEGNVPQDAELALLEEVFGKDFTDAVLKHQGLGKKLVDYANAPRALKSSIDMSAPLRQGLILSVGHPVKATRAFGEMFKAFAGEGAAIKVREQIRNSPNAHLYKESGLYLAKRLGAREENFLSRLAEKVPGVERSERAYETYLNKLRMDVFDSMVKDATTALERTGKKLEVADHKAIADFVNKASGRGSLGVLERSAPILNTVFFAPRFVASRFQVFDPRVYTRLPPGARQHAVRSMVGTLGLITTAVTLAKMGGADVETDPRSSDYGKIKVGNTRVDLWGGMLPEVRVLGQIYTGERKTQEGKVKASTPGDTLLHFTRGKLAPVPAAMADLATEKTYAGGEVTPGKEALSMFAPMFLQDVAEAFGEKKGHPELLPLAFFGAGVTTYHPSQAVSTAGQKRGIYQMLKRGAKSDKKAVSKFFYGLRKSDKKPPEANR